MAERQPQAVATDRPLSKREEGIRYRRYRGRLEVDSLPLTPSLEDVDLRVVDRSRGLVTKL